ncbi:MAG: RnfH family protein [Rudaea sp.]
MTEAPVAMIEVEVAYAERDRQVVRVARLPAGATVAQAIEATRIREVIPAGMPVEAVGIFGRPAQQGDVLTDGDRVELYRPLLLDPKEARRRRAKAGAKV